MSVFFATVLLESFLALNCGLNFCSCPSISQTLRQTRPGINVNGMPYLSIFPTVVFSYPFSPYIPKALVFAMKFVIPKV